MLKCEIVHIKKFIKTYKKVLHLKKFCYLFFSKEQIAKKT